METGENKEYEEPEPESDEDLVIDHVDGENTQTIKSIIESYMSHSSQIDLSRYF